MTDLLNGASWRVDQGDCLSWLAALPEASVDLVFGSPPYVGARLYLEDGENLGIARDAEAWAAWMVDVFRASLRVSRGLVAFVVEGQTRNFRYDCAPVLLMADLHRAGIHLRKPPIYRRVGIPGSGGPDWLRNDWEWIICATNGGKLPWSDNTALGHAPKWAPGGEMSNRQVNGQRVNQWGMRVKKDGSLTATDPSPSEDKPRARKPSHYIPGEDESVLFDGAETSPKPKLCGVSRRPRGTRGRRDEPSGGKGYALPAIANPGNIIDCGACGGGNMGDELCHENEAPFPERLAEFFVRSFCPEDGLCVDPFAGSGTTGAVCVRWGRCFLGCDLRQSQVDLSRRRIKDALPGLFAQKEE